MSKYYKIDGNDIIEVCDIEEHLSAIRETVTDYQNAIKSITDCVNDLTSESFKDEQFRRMQENLDNMRADLNRGFPISAEEAAAIQNWKREHNKTHVDGSAIGGRYEYKFIPTSLGTIGVVKCTCGAEFEFSSLK